MTFSFDDPPEDDPRGADRGQRSLLGLRVELLELEQDERDRRDEKAPAKWWMAA